MFLATVGKLLEQSRVQETSLPAPTQEQRRLNVLRSYEVLDSAAESVYDDITLLASRICGTPWALVSLVDEDRQWFKSKVGFDTVETLIAGTRTDRGGTETQRSVVP